MTGDTIAKKLNNMEIDYLKQRTEKGIVIDDMSTDKVIFFKKSDKDKLDVSNKTEQRRICNGIAKFYIKISQLYSAILKTINPQIKYVDEYGIEHIIPHSDKDKIPKYLNGFGICILSTPKGVMTGKQARVNNVGGEFLGVIS